MTGRNWGEVKREGWFSAPWKVNCKLNWFKLNLSLWRGNSSPETCASDVWAGDTWEEEVDTWLCLFNVASIRICEYVVRQYFPFQVCDLPSKSSRNSQELLYVPGVSYCQKAMSQSWWIVASSDFRCCVSRDVFETAQDVGRTSPLPASLMG